MKIEKNKNRLMPIAVFCCDTLEKALILRFLSHSTSWAEWKWRKKRNTSLFFPSSSPTQRRYLRWPESSAVFLDTRKKAYPCRIWTSSWNDRSWTRCSSRWRDSTEYNRGGISPASSPHSVNERTRTLNKSPSLSPVSLCYWFTFVQRKWAIILFWPFTHW